MAISIARFGQNWRNLTPLGIKSGGIWHNSDPQVAIWIFRPGNTDSTTNLLSGRNVLIRNGATTRRRIALEDDTLYQKRPPTTTTPASRRRKERYSVMSRDFNHANVTQGYYNQIPVQAPWFCQMKIELTCCLGITESLNSAFPRLCELVPAQDHSTQDTSF